MNHQSGKNENKDRCGYCNVEITGEIVKKRIFYRQGGKSCSRVDTYCCDQHASFDQMAHDG